MKKLVSVLLCVLLIVNSLVIISFADNVQGQDIQPVTELDSLLSDLFPQKNDIMTKLRINERTYSSLVTSIYDALVNRRNSIDTSSLNITYNSDNRTVISKIFYYCYSDFYSYGQSYSSGYGKLRTIYVNYYYNETETAAMQTEIEEASAKFLEGLYDSSLSDETKALLLHDRLVNNIAYSPNVLAGGQPTFNQTNMYGAIVDGDCVCEGYSRAYSFLLGKLGILSQLNDSDDLYHVWNIVDVDGTVYQTDVTYDDPYYDTTGRVKHTNFLVSDATLYANNHAASDYYLVNGDTYYENRYWNTSSAEVLLMDGEIYYYNGSSASLIRLSDGSVIYHDTAPYWRFSGGVWSGNYTKISCDSDYIYLSLRKDIIRVNPDTFSASTYYSPDLEYNDFNIYGFKAEDGYFYIDRYSSPNFLSDTKETYQMVYKYQSDCNHDWTYFSTITPPTFTSLGQDDYVCTVCGEHTTVETPILEHWIKGDLNNDGKVNAQDTNIICSAILGETGGVQLLDAADFNDDNKLNAVDSNLITSAVIGG